MSGSAEMAGGDRYLDINTPEGARKQAVEVALRRIDADEKELNMVYVNNETAPAELRNVFAKLVSGEISKDEATTALHELANNPNVNVPTLKELGLVAPRDVQVVRRREERVQLEARVRATLIARRANEIVESLSDPEVEEFFRAVITTSMNEVINTLYDMSDLFDDSIEKDKYLESYVSKMLTDPAERMTLAAQEATREYLTQQEIEKKLEDDFLRNLEASGLPEAAVELKALASVGAAVRARQGKIIKLLCDLAEAEGVEAAMAPESVCEVTRQVHPTADDYRNHSQEAIDATFEFVDRLSEIFSQCGETGESVGRALVKVASQAAELMKEMQKRELSKKLEVVYGEVS